MIIDYWLLIQYTDQFSLSFVVIIFADELVFDLHNRKVKLNLSLCWGGGEIVANDSGEELACLLEKGLLFGAAVGDVLKGFHGAGHLPHFNEGVDDGEGGLGGSGWLQDGGEHVQTSLGEGLEIVFWIVTLALRWF